MKATVLGDGGWGTALAMVLACNGHEVTVWGPFEDYIQEIARSRENRKFLSGVSLPESIHWTSDNTEALKDPSLIVLATPSRFFEQVCEQHKPLIKDGTLMVSVAKGLSPDGTLRMSQVAERTLGKDPVASLSGPSHAEEVARGVPTAVAIACNDASHAEQLQQAFNSPSFRVYTSPDMIGVELGGALKNIIAIAAGVSDGIGFGDNTKAALVTRGLAEMTRIGKAMGADPSTFAGLSGMGDLIVTCGSRLSRNRAVGERLGKGEKPDDILNSMEQVAEGVQTVSAALKMAKDHNIEAPIVQEVHAVIYEGKNPRQAVEDLMSRDPRPEQD